MKFWPFGKRTISESPSPVPLCPFSEIDRKTPILKYHALRALGGWLQDRHDDCRSPHPWCGDGPENPARSFIAEAIHQIDGNTGEPILAIYLIQVTFDTIPPKGPLPEEKEVLQFMAAWYPASDTPFGKLVISESINDDGTYVAYYGSVRDPVPGTFATGGLDPEGDIRSFRCNPYPDRGQYWYRDASFIPDETRCPRFYCLEMQNEWWIADAEISLQRDTLWVATHHVAAIAKVDNPEHNFGLFKIPAAGVLS
ncbi:MAG: hypothetical protein OXH30_08360, partial [Chloroflexi bacterium]|nr:hypothetical protein [Chloroflexota bacterium]